MGPSAPSVARALLRALRVPKHVDTSLQCLTDLDYM